MAKNQNAIAIGFNFFSLLPSIIKLIQLFHGQAPGADKKAAVIDLASNALADAGQAVVANNPQYKDIVGGVIDSTVGYLHATGQMPEPIALPVPVDGVVATPAQ